MSRDLRQAVQDQLDAYHAALVTIGGCDDGGCIVVKAAGMPKTTECKCSRDALKMLQVCCATHVFVGGLEKEIQT
jgi:hypothetical protein